MHCQHILTQEIKLNTNKLIQRKYDLLNDYSSPFNILQSHLKHLNHLIWIVFSLHYNTKSWRKIKYYTFFITFHLFFIENKKDINYFSFFIKKFHKSLIHFKVRHLPFNDVIQKRCKILVYNPNISNNANDQLHNLNSQLQNVNIRKFSYVG